MSRSTGLAHALSRGLSLCAAVAVTFLSLSALSGVPGMPGERLARAQEPTPRPHLSAVPAPAPDKPQAEDSHGLSDKALNKSKTAALVFWLFALVMAAGSIFVITRRNLITAVMGMVGTFFAIAAVYAMLYAQFLTAIQVLVYAGAIMVLFVFVIMVLNKPETEPWSVTNVPGKIAILFVLGYLVVRLVLVLWGIETPADAVKPPADVVLTSGEHVAFGSTKALGHTLFRDYLFPFEAVSLVLLIAVVGAIAVARPHERRPGAMPDGVEPTPHHGRSGSRSGDRVIDRPGGAESQ